LVEESLTFNTILASITLFLCPIHRYYGWLQVLLWILDSSINISMEPFRALVADKLPEVQRSNGFVIQTLIIRLELGLLATCLG
jgi:maltose/moltooligosaccharide transporter